MIDMLASTNFDEGPHNKICFFSERVWSIAESKISLTLSVVKIICKKSTAGPNMRENLGQNGLTNYTRPALIRWPLQICHCIAAVLTIQSPPLIIFSNIDDSQCSTPHYRLITADSEWKEHTFERTDSNLFFLAQNQLIGPHEVHWRQFWPSRGLSGAFLGPGWVLEHLRGPIFQIMKWTHFLWFQCSFCT